jgi:hypothetical protein
MIRITQVAFVALALTAAIVRGQPLSADKANMISQEVDTFISQYNLWFAAGRADLIAERVYAAPTTHLASDRLSVSMSKEQVQAGFEAYLKPLLNDGYARSEWTSRYIHVLHQGAVIVSGAFTRYRSDGTKIGDFAGTYVLGKTPNGWRVVANTTHDPSRVITLR